MLVESALPGLIGLGRSPLSLRHDAALLYAVLVARDLSPAVRLGLAV